MHENQNLIFPQHQEVQSNNKEKIYNKKILEIPELELEKHKKFLKSEIKKNFY